MNVEQLFEWIQAGLNQNQMAAELGVTRQWVNQYLQRHGLLDAYHERKAARMAERLAAWSAARDKPRVCTYCHQPIDDRRRRMHPDCKAEKDRAATRERNRVRYQTDPAYRAQQRAYRQANAERLREYWRGYYAANREHILDYYRAWRAAKKGKAETDG